MCENASGDLRDFLNNTPAVTLRGMEINRSQQRSLSCKTVHIVASVGSLPFRLFHISHKPRFAHRFERARRAGQDITALAASVARPFLREGSRASHRAGFLAPGCKRSSSRLPIQPCRTVANARIIRADEQLASYSSAT